MEKASLDDAPAFVRAAHPSAAWRATYVLVDSERGTATAHARVWTLPSTVGLDLVQKWRPEPATVVVYSDRYFAAVDWAGADRTQAGALVRAIERAIGIQRER